MKNKHYDELLKIWQKTNTIWGDIFDFAIANKISEKVVIRFMIDILSIKKPKGSKVSDFLKYKKYTKVRYFRIMSNIK